MVVVGGWGGGGGVGGGGGGGGGVLLGGGGGGGWVGRGGGGGGGFPLSGRTLTWIAIMEIRGSTPDLLAGECGTTGGYAVYGAALAVGSAHRISASPSSTQDSFSNKKHTICVALECAASLDLHNYGAQCDIRRLFNSIHRRDLPLLRQILRSELLDPLSIVRVHH